MFGGSQQLPQAQPCHHRKSFRAAQIHFCFSQTKGRPGVRLETLGCISCPVGCGVTEGPQLGIGAQFCLQNQLNPNGNGSLGHPEVLTTLIRVGKCVLGFPEWN